MENSDSIYREAVTKLKILLSATQISGKDGGGSEGGRYKKMPPKPNTRKIFGTIPQENKMKRRVNSWHNLTNTSENLSEKSTRDEKRRELFGSQQLYLENTGSPRVSRIPEPYPPSRDPTLFKNNYGSNTGIFQNQFVQPVEHKLISPEHLRHHSPSSSPALRALVHRQEKYIHQLEMETELTRSQLTQFRL
ncbi:uncharacterized protein LOC111715707 [Eurytemora carolleeae]|uniref:uncharacterized protein LOC111715707 n=1 Tax=Eurytemora carolleeae TaxID=1294199 RepID=UPI000C776DA4|nr:uncharacterized protein LOC111715707 [Eurytemora carolleeae]|eukprot:XP_023346839.1 uncharacterized protein LOC111715707 [Eurytemora affinis]